MLSVITKSSQKKDKRQVKMRNLEREYRDCIKSRRDTIGITRHNVMMHQVLYIVTCTLYSTWCIMICLNCDPNLVSSAFYKIAIFPF